MMGETRSLLKVLDRNQLHLEPTFRGSPIAYSGEVTPTTPFAARSRHATEGTIRPIAGH